MLRSLNNHSIEFCFRSSVAVCLQWQLMPPLESTSPTLNLSAPSSSSSSLSLSAYLTARSPLPAEWCVRPSACRCRCLGRRPLYQRIATFHPRNRLHSRIRTTIYNATEHAPPQLLPPVCSLGTMSDAENYGQTHRHSAVRRFICYLLHIQSHPTSCFALNSLPNAPPPHTHT